MRLLLALVLIALPVQAAEPEKQEDVYCSNGFCMIRQETLLNLLKGIQQLDAHSKEMRKLCGWDR